MKKERIGFCLLSIIILILACVAMVLPEKKVEYLRLHVRANSNSEVDQTVKYAVKQAVVDYLAPLVADITDKVSAEKIITENLPKLNELCDKVLQEKGFAYKSTVSYRQEYFPTRVYDDTELSAGVYDALIINLGEGSGDNWWCVVYPPLCFTAYGTDFVYKSKIIEIINDFKNKGDK